MSRCCAGSHLWPPMPTYAHLCPPMPKEGAASVLRWCCVTEAPRKHHGSATEAPRKHHGSTTEAPRNHHGSTTRAPRESQGGPRESQGAPRELQKCIDSCVFGVYGLGWLGGWLVGGPGCLCAWVPRWLGGWMAWVVMTMA